MKEDYNMSNRERALQLINSVPDERLIFIMAMSQQITSSL